MDLLGKPILVPVDGSELAESALPSAKRLATAMKSELLLARITPLSLIPYDLSGGAASARAYQQLADDEHRLATEYVQRLAADLSGQGMQVKTTVQRGEPASTLLEIEARQGVGLVVMTTHGRTGLARFTLGSTADRLVRHSHIPVLLLRPTVADREEETFARVIVPLDGSPLSESALQVVAPLAGRLLQRITLLHVIPLDASAEAASEAERYLNAVRERLGGQVSGQQIDQPCTIDIQIARGVADEQIIEQAETHRSPIVMATHGDTGIRRWSYGSNADQVLHQAQVPVLLVHPPLAELPPILTDIESGAR